MNAVDYILRKYSVRTDVIEIPNTGRDDIAQVLHELDFKVGVEVGVADGEFSYTLTKLNPQMKLYGIDPYLPHKDYDDYIRPETFEKLKTDAHKRLDAFDNYEFIEEFSPDAASRFADGSLDFVYLDANHRTSAVTKDIEAWTPKVRSGGIVAGHDYARIGSRIGIDGNHISSSNWGVVPAVNQYVATHKLQLFIWGLSARLPGLKRENSRSWMFIQP